MLCSHRGALLIRLAVISGKGGTGKTMITAALANLLPRSLVLADCDVDAANLGILLAPKRIWMKPFYGMNAAVIDPALCTSCGVCGASCRFHAVVADEQGYRINPIRCEGCGVCAQVCPNDAICMEPRICGEICLSSTSVGDLAHARLRPGAGNSGLLVHEVKKTAIQADNGCDLLLVDGPPGTGCPLISTITGMNVILIVTEPSVSGLHDLKRVASVARQFTGKIVLAINRFDLDMSHTEMIERWCLEERILVIGKIPFDSAVIEAVRNRRAITCTDTSLAAQAIQTLAANLLKSLEVE
jgi:MinD superfamily P-loop ATPase